MSTAFFTRFQNKCFPAQIDDSLTLIRELSGPSSSTISGKSKTVAGDVTLTLIRESLKIQTHEGPKFQSIPSIRVCFSALNFCFRKTGSVTLAKKWHIFLFRVAYFPSCWHMPFEICIDDGPKNSRTRVNLRLGAPVVT